MNWKLASLISLGSLALAWSQSCTHKYGDDCEVERSCIEDVGGAGGGGGVGGQGGSAGADACEETCGGAAPVCEAGSRECVECTSSDHCPGGVCDPDSHACEQCLESSDCTEAAAPRCADNACTSCTESSDCAHFADAKLCGHGLLRRLSHRGRLRRQRLLPRNQALYGPPSPYAPSL